MNGKRNGALIGIFAFAVFALIFGLAVFVSTQGEAYTGSVEYGELTSAHTTTSTVGTEFKGDVLVCVYNTTGGSFSGTVYLEIKHSLGSGKDEWIRTGDVFTAEGCTIIEVPENGVNIRGTSTVSSGSIRFRASQQYPLDVKVWRN